MRPMSDMPSVASHAHRGMGLTSISEVYSTMTKPDTPVPSAIFFSASASRWLMISSVLALAACSSTPLPPWPNASVGTATPRTNTVPAGTNAPASQAQVMPVAPNARLEALPYGAEIAALFPAPDAQYSTPGLSPERRSFTTNTELAELLQELSQHRASGQPRLSLLHSGNTQSGAPLYAFIASRATSAKPMALDETNLPTVMLIAGQRGTDAAATEALLVIAKELDSGGSLTPLLDKINIVLVPRANPDGFDKGIATTADGTDLRFDHLQLKTPEARFLAKLVRDYRPSVLLDGDEFAAIEPSLQRFGTVRANDVGLQYALTPNAHEFITKAAREWMHEPTLKTLSQAGLRVDWAYEAVGQSAQDGFAMGTLQPTSLRNVSSLKNVVSMGVESRGSDLGHTHIQRRVHSHVQAMTAVLQSAAQRGNDLHKVQTFVTRDVASKACNGTLTVQAQPRTEARELTMIDAATAQMVQKNVPWRSSLNLNEARTRKHACGYWLSANAVEATERLNMLGVIVNRVGELSSLQAQTYQINADTTSVNLTSSALEAAPGSFYVSMNQPLAYLAAAALEPDTPYSYYSTGVIKNLAETARVVALPNIVFDEE